MPRMCFSFQSDLPPGIESRAVAPPGLRRMPAGACFSYPSSVPVPLCRYHKPRYHAAGPAEPASDAEYVLPLLTGCLRSHQL